MLLFWQPHPVQDGAISQPSSASNDNTPSLAAESNTKSEVVEEIEGLKFTFRCVYVLLFASFVCMFSLSFRLHTVVRDSTDISVFETFLKSDFANSEVEMIVQKYLNRMKLSNQDMSATTEPTTAEMTATEEEKVEDDKFKSAFEYR